MDQVTAAGLWRFSSDYCDAAFETQRSKGNAFFDPTYYLHGHSIELALKGFLRGRGTSAKVLKDKYGHNLKLLLTECSRRKLGSVVSLPHDEKKVICLLGETYSRKRFEYILTGTIRVPPLIGLRFVNRKLVSGLRDFCILKSGYSMTSPQ